MWYDDPFVKFNRKRVNRKRRRSRETILLVSARASQQRRDTMHKVGRLVLLLVALAGLTWLLLMGGRWLQRVLFTENPKYAVRTFDVGSDGHKIPPALLMEYAGLYPDVNLFALDLAAIRESLGGVPLVHSVEIRRILPDKLAVRVVERVPVARFGPDQSPLPMAIDRQGYLLGRGSRSGNLPLITGKSSASLRPGQKLDDPAVQDALEVLETIDRSRGLSRLIRIDRLDIEGGHHLVLFLDAGQRVTLGRENIDERLRKLAVWIQNAAETGQEWRELNLTVDKNLPAV